MKDKTRVQPIITQDSEFTDDNQDDLTRRIEQLENAYDSTQFSLGVVNEFFTILSKHSIGKQAVNRAVNLYKLHQLRYVVLPRRKLQLQEISVQPMPKGIRDSFIQRELLLIKNATRAINKREQFEKKASVALRTFFDKLSDLNKQVKALS